MAASGSLNTSNYEGRYLTFSWEEKSQSIANNTTTISWTLKGAGAGSSTYYKARNMKVVIDGTTAYYQGAGSASNYIDLHNGTLVASGTHTFTHADDGTKSFKVSVEGGIYVWAVNCTGSKTFTLDTIPRKSTMSVANGTLGTAQTLTVTKKATSFTHTITYTCGSASGTVCTKSSSTSISFTPPISLANQNTTGTTVTVKYTITTYSGSTSVGSNSYTVTCSIPASVKPSCSLTVTDATGHATTYGGYIKGISKFKVTVTATTSYGSAIASYKTTANGSTYTTSSFTTNELSESGTLKVAATVTDKRNRSGSASTSLTVIDYSMPTISLLTLHRCDADGTENGQGEYVEVVFSGSVTSLNNKNTSKYVLEYKKATEDTYTTVELTDLNNVYSTENTRYIFPADTGSSYNIRVTITDNFNTGTRTATASTGFTLMHWLASGLGMAVGKVSELSNVFDIGLQTRMMGGILPPTLEPETNLNDIMTPNTYIGDNISTNNYANCPVTSGTFTLIVESCGESGQVKQTYISCSKYKPERYSRFYYQEEWGDWFWASTDEVVLYENSAGSNGTITLWASASHYRYLEIYFTDNNGKTGGYTKVWSPNGKDVCLSIHEGHTTVYIRQTNYTISGTTITPDTARASYTRFESGAVTGTATAYNNVGTNYIKIVRVIGRA